MTPEITGEYKHKKFFSKNTVRQKNVDLQKHSNADLLNGKLEKGVYNENGKTGKNIIELHACVFTSMEIHPYRTSRNGGCNCHTCGDASACFE
jgi:hypothetical protein